MVLDVPLLSLFGIMVASGFGFAVPSVRVESVPMQNVSEQKRSPNSAPVRTSPPTLKPSSTFTTFNSQPLDRQLKLYLRYLEEFGPPDILIVGSSRAYQGVDPLVLQQVFSRRGYENVKVFNFGVNGATAQVVDLILRRLLTQEQLPRLILWADGSRAFNSGRPDRTYSKILASPGYKRLATGIRPSLSPSEINELKPLCVTMSSPAAFTKASSSSKVMPPQANNPQFCIQTTPHSTPSAWVIKSYPQPAEGARSSSVLGFNALSTRFNPTSYFQRYPRVPGRYDTDYINFTLRGEQTTAFKQAVNFARSRQIPVVFVNLPLTQIYLDPVRSSYEQQFRSYMQQFANAGKLTFYDLSQRWPYSHDYFADPSHLNRYGAAVVSTQIGQNLKLPKTVAQ
ncbi:MAG: hypothetical protein K6T90_19250 [Leptolyngbyaceae cyanobacterium HOT.MB2.61]|nr:hypothetical protein [Leptolyngbyaceae cyanobacterium HOT.MB2.61]